MTKVFLTQIETELYSNTTISDLGVFESQDLAIEAGKISGRDSFFVTEFELNANNSGCTFEFFRIDLIFTVLSRTILSTLFTFTISLLIIYLIKPNKR